MKIYILLLLLLLIGCSSVENIPQDNPVVNPVNDVTINKQINLNKTVLKSKYYGVYGVYNFTEFKIENCEDLIKKYNLILAEENFRIDNRKNKVGEVRGEFRKALDEFDKVKDQLEDIERNKAKENLQKLNETVIARENSLKETKDYFVKVRLSLRLIENECKRLKE